MCIKLRADGVTRQPGNTLGTYAFSTPHRGHSIVQCSHRRLGLHLSETVGTWTNPEAFDNLENTLDLFCLNFQALYFVMSVADGKVKETPLNSYY
jgi:hypothetical protein